MFYNVRTGRDRMKMIAARTVFGGTRAFLEVAALRDRGDRRWPRWSRRCMGSQASNVESKETRGDGARYRGDRAGAPLRFVRRRGPCRSCRQAWRDLWLPGSKWRREVDDHSHALHAYRLEWRAGHGRWVRPGPATGTGAAANRGRAAVGRARHPADRRRAASAAGALLRALAIGYRYP